MLKATRRKKIIELVTYNTALFWNVVLGNIPNVCMYTLPDVLIHIHNVLMYILPEDLGILWALKTNYFKSEVVKVSTIELDL